MKNSWISDKLPEMETITSDWKMSKTMLIVVRSIHRDHVTMANLVDDYKGLHWRTDTHMFRPEEVSHWQPIELPELLNG